MTDKTLLLIGGTGFFGKSTLDAHSRGLLAPWNIRRIVIVARNAHALRAQAPMLLGPDIVLLDADAATAATLPVADYVIHAASSADADRYHRDPAGERANILGSIDNFCRIAASAHAGAKILYASSGAVYGQQQPDIDRLSEDHEPAASSSLTAYKRDYADAKRAAEQRIAMLGAGNIAVSVARCFAFIGPWLPRERHFAIGNFLADGLAGRPVTVKARHPVIRSYMHADDLVRWLMTIADHAAADCPIWNVGSDESVSITDLAIRVAHKFGVTAVLPQPSAAEVDRYVPSVDRARRELGLGLEHDLDSALDATIALLHNGGRHAA